jgi:hypothetical protein
MSCVIRGALFAVAFLLMTEHTTVRLAHESPGPEAAIRRIVCAGTTAFPPTPRTVPLQFRSILFVIEVCEGSPLPKKKPIPSYVDWVSHLCLCYSHLHPQMRAQSGLQQKRGAGVSQITWRANVVLSLLNWACSDSQEAQGHLDAAE